ncbi:MAG: alpha/beta fold hydrolase [Candidatus Lokiarchaeota archaeon]|nr:alpha/beta fold hydrolase [Candidatus Lokiarchaeota archaeon]
MEFEKAQLDEDARNRLSLSFVELSKGWVNYELKGSKEQDLVLFLHGFSIPNFIWDKNFEEIADAGYCTLRFDFYGRGFSARPKCKYDTDLFDNQIIELLNRLNLGDKKVNIIGLSMGGTIAMTFADRHPEKVKSLILVDPAGLPQPTEFKQKLLKIPVLNKLLFRFIGNQVLINGLENNFYDFSKFPEFEDKFIEQMKYKGYRNAIVSTYQHMPMFDIEHVYKRVGKSKLPVLLIWGEEDQVVPYSQHNKALELLPNAEFHAIAKAGHNSNYECAEIVNSHIKTFLSR